MSSPPLDFPDVEHIFLKRESEPVVFLCLCNESFCVCVYVTLTFGEFAPAKRFREKIQGKKIQGKEKMQILGKERKTNPISNVNILPLTTFCYYKRNGNVLSLLIKLSLFIFVIPLQVREIDQSRSRSIEFSTRKVNDNVTNFESHHSLPFSRWIFGKHTTTTLQGRGVSILLKIDPIFDYDAFCIETNDTFFSFCLWQSFPSLKNPKFRQEFKVLFFSPRESFFGT